MTGYDQDSENENWQQLRDNAFAGLMDLLSAQVDLSDQIEAQCFLIALFESLLRPPE